MSMHFDYSITVKREDKKSNGMRFEHYTAQAFDHNGILIAKGEGWSENGARNNAVGQVFKYYREFYRRDVAVTNKLNGSRIKNWKPISIDYRRL